MENTLSPAELGRANAREHPPALLLTGRPGVGKTTVIRTVLTRLSVSAGGFYTSEVRQRGRRTGFELVTLAGEVSQLATTEPHVHFHRAARMGRYRVNLGALDEVGVPALRRTLEAGTLVVVDEIGPMELLSEPFREIVFHLLDTDLPLIGTVYGRSHLVANLVKDHPRVWVWTVTTSNRNELPARLAAILRPFVASV
jgi:nucleoside-triphosphatase